MSFHDEITTTDAGIPASSDEFSLTVGANGPTLLQDHYLIQKEGVAHFRRLRVGLAGVLALLLPAAGAAINCQEWSAMTPERQMEWLTERIHWGVTESVDARKISVDRPAMSRCMMRHRQLIVDDFDSICSEGNRRPRSALDESLQGHFWSCVGG